MRSELESINILDWSFFWQNFYFDFLHCLKNRVLHLQLSKLGKIQCSFERDKQISTDLSELKDVPTAFVLTPNSVLYIFRSCGLDHHQKTVKLSRLQWFK